MEKKQSVIGIGEALFDVLPEGKKLGGAPANFAYHVSQFGLESCAVSAMGDDELGKDVVFGPAYLVVCDVPMPLAIPYGFFPFTKSYSSGFIMPTYGDETARGFYLRDGGYYFAMNDKWDLKLLGEIYTKGSWGLSAASNYRKRYKYSGSFFFSYQDTKNGDKGMPDFTEQESFKLQWSHRQDSKANPYSSLSASVNFATSSYERNNLNSLYNPQTMTQSTRTSSVNWSTNTTMTPKMIHPVFFILFYY